ncbi:ARM repeat-containing protein [Artomyces pyxidatus]|uniref:ARM repeat-containing protein n=1 Tax=Artomyces pyxidatus TaxID=48021 RepID=A0ACB8TLE0_9AGAM|nr:ARM repeat-containing protein [Artomyces pyxidatus]
MPRENRKRGKKHKKVASEEAAYEVQRPVEDQPEEVEEQQSGPSWIVPAQDNNRVDSEAPFGYVDADIKAYFRTVETQLKEWQENAEENAEGDIDPNENRRIFLMAALQEMSGKERELATDPECAAVLERMAHSMDDFVRRVFVDSLTGSYEQLVKHRFASHVIQTLLTVAVDTVGRESRGVFPTVEESSDKGELLTLTKLILDFIEEILPSFSSLIMDPFASHVMRALLVLLCPHLFLLDASHKSQYAVRSKKSAAWKAKQGPFKSIFNDSKDKGKGVADKSSPPEFMDAAKRFVVALRTDLSENEIRSLAANKVASPVLQMVLEIEADQNMSDEPDSLMDRALVGLITLQHNDPSAVPESSDFLSTLLRDPTSSHLLETLVSRAPDSVFHMLWATYFEGRLPKLSIHPVANFVVAKILERVSAEQLGGVLQELGGTWMKLRSSRVGVLRALVDRSAASGALEEEVLDAIYSAFELQTTEDRKMLVSCVLYLKSPQEYTEAKAAAEKQPDPLEEGERHKKKGRAHKAHDTLEPKTAGALLLQSLLQLPDPHNHVVLNSVQSMSIDNLIALAHHNTSSRVLDMLLDSRTVSSKSKRTFLLSLIGHYHTLVDDRIGSHVGDRCWAAADPYLKEKIARSLIPHEAFLAGSFYGKFFARNLNLYLLQRRPEDWRTLQASRSHPQAAPALAPIPAEPTPESAAPPKKKRKREAVAGDEIDALFEHALGKKVKKGSLAAEAALAKGRAGAQADGLGAVLGAIQSAPKGEDRGKKKRGH